MLELAFRLFASNLKTKSVQEIIGIKTSDLDYRFRTSYRIPRLRFSSQRVGMDRALTDSKRWAN
jgi:hypothetical protein